MKTKKADLSVETVTKIVLVVVVILFLTITIFMFKDKLVSLLGTIRTYLRLG